MKATRREYRLPKDCTVRQSGRHLEVVNHRTRRIVRTVTPPATWGDRWGWNTMKGGFYIERTQPKTTSGKAKSTAAATYAERQRDIASLLDWIGLELEKHAEKAAATPDDWSLAGDLYRVRSGLKETLSSLSGAAPEEIEQNLDELRM